MDTTEAIIAEAARLLSMSGVIPVWAVMLAVIGLAVLLVLSPSIGRIVWSAIKRIKIEPAPPPVSDGGSAEDEAMRARYDVTAPIPLGKPRTLDDGGDAG